MKTQWWWMALAGMVCLAAGCKQNGIKPDGSGTIECTQVQVAPEVGGRILRLLPHEGAALKKGDLVAELDARDYQLRRDEAKAALGVAQAQLDLLRAGARVEDLQRAKEQVRECRAAKEAAEADLARVTRVYEQKTATQKQFDDAKTAVERTAAAQAAAEQNLKRLENGSRKEEISVAEAQVDQARVRVAQAEKAIADCVVRAPADGVVTVRVREEGEMASPGSTLITVSELDEVWLSVYVPEPSLGRVKIGQAARVRIDGDGREFEGKVTFVSPEAEFTPRNVQTPDERAKLVFRVKITLPNTNGIFKPGMPADGFLAP
jgi:HlyD family secretion protein